MPCLIAGLLNRVKCQKCFLFGFFVFVRNEADVVSLVMKLDRIQGWGLISCNDVLYIALSPPQHTKIRKTCNGVFINVCPHFQFSAGVRLCEENIFFVFTNETVPSFGQLYICVRLKAIADCNFYIYLGL